MSHALWTAPIGKLTFEDVVAFCKMQLKENIRLEYKREFSSKHEVKQITKEICAFANTQGGLLIFGVGEKTDRMPEESPQGQALGDNARDSVIQSCHANIFPPVVPEISEFLPNPQQSELGFLVVRIAPSAEIPHAMEDGRRVYVRVYDKSEPKEATVAKIEHMLERRNARLSLQEERMDRGMNRLANALGVIRRPSKNPTGFIAVGIGPVIMDAPDVEFSKRGAEAARRSACVSGEVFSVIDGLHSVDAARQLGWLADDYGNEIFAASGERFKYLRDIQVDPLIPVQRFSSHEGGLSTCVAVEDVLRPLCYVVDAAWRSHKSCEFFGLMRLRLVCEDLLRWSLALSFSRSEWQAIAATQADRDLEFSFDFASTDFGPEGWKVSLQAASLLLRGWGAHPEAQARADELLDCAERMAFRGQEPCDCDNVHGAQTRPPNHAHCLRCRTQADAGSA